jgi:hypothetical protein
LKPKQIISLVLLLFVGASVVYLAMNETAPATSEVVSEEIAAPDQVEQAKTGRVVTATYFHGNTRCITCNKLETYSQQAIAAHLATYVDDGSLVWQTINYEVPPNEHYVEDYQLAYQSLVLQEYVDGQPGEFVDLKKIWDLVGDEEAFVEYVADGITTFMEQP